MSEFSVIKTSIKGDKPINQDAVLFYENDVLIVLALADGLGSAPHSAQGSLAICRTVIKNVKRAMRFSKPLSVAKIKADWRTSLQKKGLKPSECLTTSSFVIINKREKKVTTAQIGDSQIHIITDDVTKESLAQKDFANITDCIGDQKDVHYNTNTLFYNKSIRVLITSDGICDELESGKIPIVFANLVNCYSSIPQRNRNAALSREVRNSFSKLNSDDKSMIFLWNK